MDVVFSGQMHPVTVMHTETPYPGFRSVRFEGPLQKCRYTPGNVVEFRVNDTDYRHYTPSSFDSEKGICEILFYLHDRGPGSAWASQLSIGDSLRLMGPGGRISFREASSRHIVFGDETSVGLGLAIQNECRARKAEVTIIIEADKTCHEFVGKNGPDWFSLDRQDPHWERLILDTAGKRGGFLTGTSFYLSGRAKSIQRLRNLLKENGVEARQIFTEPYWEEGKKGL